jgi:hypothetical protein
MSSIVLINTEELIANAGNPRTYSAKQISQIAASQQRRRHNVRASLIEPVRHAERHDTDRAKYTNGDDESFVHSLSRLIGRDFIFHRPLTWNNFASDRACLCLSGGARARRGRVCEHDRLPSQLRPIESSRYDPHSRLRRLREGSLLRSCRWISDDVQ